MDLKGAPVRGLRAMAGAITDLVGRLRPEAGTQPPWERSVLDDIAMRRPWNLRLKLERRAALLRLGSLDDGVTVIVVNWNTKEVTADVIRRVQELSPPGTRILLVDNGSTDGSAELFSRWPGVQAILLGANAGHGVALDLAVCRTRTKVAVTLDSDAIPLTRDWLDAAVPPVAQGRAVLAGLRARRNFVHPVYAAVDTASFVRRNLSFQTFVPRGVEAASAVWGETAWDTAELLTSRLSPDEVFFVDRTPNLVDGLPGMTTGGVVYHHGGVSRGAAGAVEPQALEGWRDACSRLADAAGTTDAVTAHADDGISIVIPVRNGAKTLAEQLDALEASVDPGVFEVVVADNGSTDATVAMARSYEGRLPIRVVDASAAPGSNYARNCGIRAARFDSILLCDADDQVDAQWIATMRKAFAAGAELVAGPIDYVRLNPASVRKWRGADRAFAEVILDFLPTGHGANLGFRRSTYDRLGGFDDDFEFGGPDVEFCWRAQLAGVKLWPVPEAVVHYRLRPTLKALYRQSKAYGAAQAHLYRKFCAQGMRRRPLVTPGREVWWLISRAPFAVPLGRRGAWVRRLGTHVGRLKGSVRYRVLWW